MSDKKIFERDVDIDFTKGILVVLMVVYHGLNYFMDIWSVIKYIYFLTGSFVFISGFLISYVYLDSYKNRYYQMYIRLIKRGLKLLLIFIVLNVIISILFKYNYRGHPFQLSKILSDAYYIFLIGDVKMAFEILIPISYLLIISAPILYMIINGRRIVAMTIIVVTILVCLFYGDGLRNLRYLSIGMIGILTGNYVCDIKTIVNNNRVKIIILFIIYNIFISFYYPPYALYTVGVIANLSIIYLISINSNNFLKKDIILLGCYSLVGYIVQIALLQILYRITKIIKISYPTSSTMLAISISIKIVYYSRMKSNFINNMYKYVFS
jgi:hypothetical protein